MDQIIEDNVEQRDPLFFLNDDIDDIDFTPLSSGLGFNNHAKEDVVISKRKTVKKPLPKKTPSSLAISSGNSRNNSVAASSLEQFYGKSEVKEESVQKQDLNVGKKKIVEKSENLFAEQFLAWVLDVISVILLLSCVAYIAPRLARVNMDLLLKVVFQKDVYLYLAAFSGAFYLLYFSILDLYQTPGKLLCNIKVVSQNGTRASFFSIIFRNILNTISLIFLGLPIVFGVVDFLSKTKVVRDDS